MKAKTCRLSVLADYFKLKLITKGIDYDSIEIRTKNLNRPGIQLTGFFELFDKKRIQIMGYVETAYMEQMDPDKKVQVYEQLLSLGAPCYVFCRDIKPDGRFTAIAAEKKIPVFSTPQVTCDFMSAAIRWIGEQLAPSIILNGCLVDINGVGVLIRGESGIGKSEAVVALLKRGHRLISDDVVEICKASEKTLFGKAPDIVRDFLEIRGIGIVDVKNMFGVQAIKETQTIELVVTLKEWNTGDTLAHGEDQAGYVELLGNKILHYEIPVRPGRNLAVILEAAALNCRARRMGIR